MDNTTKTHYAAIGTDGTRPVVWGLGYSEAAARADAADWLGGDGRYDTSDGVAMTVVAVTDEQASAIDAGVIDWESLRRMSSDDAK